MAPFVHTYLSPQGERRMCCASREPAQNFEQYIDTTSNTGKYIPITLAQHWNSEHMISVRARMLAGETLPECEVCNEKLLNTNVYRDYFWHLFGHKYESVCNSTTPEGITVAKPISWDYRFSNLCNFKCRACGDMLSSSWEVEERQNNMIDWTNKKNDWMRPTVRKQISEFQDSQVEAEFSQAVEEHRIEEIYWAGGEPLMYEQHWKYMQRIIELGDGPNVYARYNTNLSRMEYKGINLFDDILPKIRNWQVCASLDGTGKIGEYIRTGLNYDEWLVNFVYGIRAATQPNQMRIDFTLTLPGMFEVSDVQSLAQRFNTQLLVKVIFSFTSDIVMSPLALPRSLLNAWIDDLVPLSTGAMLDTLQQLKIRPNFEEQWPIAYKSGVARGKRRIMRLEEIRPLHTTMRSILSARPEVLEWWDAI